MDSTTEAPPADPTQTTDPAAPTPYDTNNFDDQNQLSATIADTRGQDTFALSTTADALAAIQTFRSSTATSPWTSLDRNTVADRLVEIVNLPRVITQGALNLCGPAAFFVIVASRHPVAFAQAATALYDAGTCTLGGLTIAPKSDLTSTSYADMLPKMGGSVAPQADWMLLGSLRNSTEVFWQPNWTGNPDQELAGMTRPEELADWLRSTGFFTNVVDGGKWASNPGIPAATDLKTDTGYDNALLINAKMLSTAKVLTSQTIAQGQPAPLAPAGFGPDTQSFITSGFPNHWVLLLNQITPSVFTDADGNRYVTLSIWTWGQTFLQLWIPQDDFVNNYYGAVTAYVTPPQ